MSSPTSVRTREMNILKAHVAYRTMINDDSINMLWSTMTLRTLWFLRCQGGSGRTAVFFSPLPWAAEAGVAGVTSRRPTRSKIWTVIWHGRSRTLEEKRCYKVMEEPNLSKIIDKLIRLISDQNFRWKRLSGPNEHTSFIALQILTVQSTDM